MNIHCIVMFSLNLLEMNRKVFPLSSFLKISKNETFQIYSFVILKANDFFNSLFHEGNKIHPGIESTNKFYNQHLLSIGLSEAIIKPIFHFSLSLF